MTEEKKPNIMPLDKTVHYPLSEAVVHCPLEEQTVHYPLSESQPPIQEGILSRIKQAARNLFKRLFGEKPTLQLHNHGGNTCAYCQNLDGETYTPKNAPFLPIHPNCQCTLDPIFTEKLTEAENQKICYLCGKPADYALTIYTCVDCTTEENLIQLIKAALETIAKQT